MTDRQIIAAQLSHYFIPTSFVPVTDPKPEQPMSLFDKFGTIVNNPDYYDVFNNKYAPISKTWDTEDLTIVPQILRDNVAEWVVVLENYDVALVEWNINYELQNDLQWRLKLADAILAS
jgi:hypothetical protein